MNDTTAERVVELLESISEKLMWIERGIANLNSERISVDTDDIELLLRKLIASRSK